MSTKLEYLKKCITTGKVIGSKKWYILGFAVPILKDTPDWQSKELYELVTQPDGLYYVDKSQDDQLTLTKIVDYKKDQPLFGFQDDIEVDSTWLPTISGKITTKVGQLVVNALVFYPTLGKKVDYINGKIKVGDIEAIFVNRVRNDNVAKEGDILVSEMLSCIDRLTFLSNLSTLISVASTPKTITKPPGVEELKKKLFAEYKDQLSDPVKLVEMENRLRAFDEEYLKDDPAAKNILSKKAKIARTKMFLTFGETKDFVKTDDVNVVTASLSDGLDTSPENFPKYMNDLRFGSFGRGNSTALSGYTYKILQRSIAGIYITPTPCNTTKGLSRLITNSNYKNLVNRYIKEKGWKLVEDLNQAKSYVGKTVETRSSMFCTTAGNMVCYACMSEGYKNIPSGATSLAADISSVFMKMFLKIVHGSETEVIDIDMNDLCR